MNIDLSGYSANLEESQEKLTELGSILDQTNDILQKASDDLRLIESRQEQANQSFQENATSLLESLSEFVTNSEARLDDVNRVKEGFDSYVESSISSLSSITELATALISSTQQELSNQEEGFTTSLKELADIITQFLGDANLSVESANAEIALFMEGANQLSTKVTEGNDQLSGITDKISSLFENFSNSFLGSIQSSADSIYTSAFSTLNEEQTRSIEETITGVSSQLEDSLESFSESCTSVAEELVADVGALLEDCTADISDNIQQKLSNAFEDAIQNILSEVLKELAATAVTMGVGSTISGTMMPLVPALTTVGEALEGLNNAIDFFD